MPDPSLSTVLDRFTATGSFEAAYGADTESGASGSGPGQFRKPNAVVTDVAGNVYVADTANNRVELLGPNGGFITSWGGAGSRPGRFREPTGLALDTSGNVYVVDRLNNRVQAFDPRGRFLGGWGTRGTDPGQFVHPMGIAIDCAGNILVSDTDNNRVQRFRPVSSPPSSCAAPVAPALPRAPKLTLSVRRGGHFLRRRALALTVQCDEACLLTATAKLKAKRGRAVSVKSAARALAANQRVVVKLRVSRAVARKLRRKLGRGRRIVASVSVSGSARLPNAQVGPSATLTQRVRLRG